MAGTNVLAVSGDNTVGYRPSLDGLRALAVCGVMGWHLFGTPLMGGRLGVDLFLVLSGFLITTLLWNEFRASGTIRLRDFFARRGLRLLPALIWVSAATAVLYSLVNAADAPETVWPGVPAALFYASSWLAAAQVPLGGLQHAWTLSVEEHFYFFWPLTILFILKTRVRASSAVLGIYLVTLLYRSVAAVAVETPDILSYRFDMRAHQLMIGCAAALFLLEDRLANIHKKVWDWAFWVSVLVSGLTIGAYPKLVTIWLEAGPVPMLVAILFAFQVTYVWSRPSTFAASLLSTNLLSWIGRRAYGLYLIHAPLAHLWIDWNQPWSHKGPRILFVTALSFLLAGLSYRFVERPFLRMRGKFRRTLPFESSTAEVRPAPAT